MGINLADDALFTTLDVAGSYKSFGEVGLEFGKKAACALVNVGARMHGRAVSVANDQPRMHGRAVSVANDQPRMHGRAVSVANDQPRMHGRAVSVANDQPRMHGRAVSVANDQPRETFKATQAHTRLALALLGSSEYGRQMNAAVWGSKNLQKDIREYLNADGDFEQYVKDNYDSSADYWKIIVQRDASGNIIGNQLIDDLSGDLTVEDGGKTTIYKTGVSAANRYDWMAKAFGTDKEGLVQALLGTKLMLGTATGTALDKSLWMSINQDQLTYLTARATSMRTGTLPSYAEMSEANKIHKVDWDTWSTAIKTYNASIMAASDGISNEIISRMDVDQRQKEIMLADVYWQMNSMINARDNALGNTLTSLVHNLGVGSSISKIMEQGISSITGRSASFIGSNPQNRGFYSLLSPLSNMERDILMKATPQLAMAQINRDKAAGIVKSMPIISTLYSANNLLNLAFNYGLGLSYGDAITGRKITGEQAQWAALDVGMAIGSIIAGGYLDKLCKIGTIDPAVINNAAIKYLDDINGAAGNEAEQGLNFAQKVFLSEKFGITSDLFGNSAAGVKGILNQSGSWLKAGWSTVAKDGGGMQFRVGFGTSPLNSNQALFHFYLPMTFVPNAFANPSILVKQSLLRLAGK